MVLSRFTFVRAALLILSLLPAAAWAQKGPVSVKLPGSGDYLVWAVGTTADGQVPLPQVKLSSAAGSYDLGTPPAGLKQYDLYVLDQRTGLVARKPIPAKEGAPAAVDVAASDFTLVHRLQVAATGAGGKPLANATVALQDASEKKQVKVLDVSAAGSVVFEDVPVGTAKLTVTPAGGGSITQEIRAEANVGGSVKTVAVALPDAKDVVEAPSPAAATTPAAPGASTAPGTPAAPSTGTTASAPPVAAPATPAPTTPPAPVTPSAPQAPGPGSSALSTLLSLLILAGLIYGGYVLLRQRGWTLDRVLAQLGVQPIAEAPGVGRTAAAPPPTVTVDPNVCAFCGERKDPVTGRCACSVDAAPAGMPVAAPATSGSGPRLVATQGIYLGRIFLLAGEAYIGRDPGNAVPLPEDTTVSRRHARIASVNGDYQIQDEGSSNGTFVNGMRVTEASLRSGDEVSIGGTRFRFEV